MIEAEAVVAQGTLKAVCPRNELIRALGIVSRGVSTRTSVQILAGILLEAGDGNSSSAAKWSSTKTRIGSAISAGLKDFSSGSPKNSAEGRPSQRRLLPPTGAAFTR